MSGKIRTGPVPSLHDAGWINFSIFLALFFLRNMRSCSQLIDRAKNLTHFYQAVIERSCLLFCTEKTTLQRVLISCEIA